MIAIGRVMFGAGAGMHQWNIRNRNLFNILYARLWDVQITTASDLGSGSRYTRSCTDL